LKYHEIIDLIKSSNNIAVLSHIMPDGDNIGSSLALYNALINYGKKMSYILDDEVPEVYRFLKGAHEVKKPHDLKGYDLIIALDCGDIERLGESGKRLEGKMIINIDHHVSNTRFGNVNFVDTSASATGEIIYELLRELNIEFNKDIAECIYVAISTDTGHFQYSNTTSKTHEIAAELLKCNIDAHNLYRKVYLNTSIQKVKLMSEALNTLEFAFDNKVSIISLTQNVMGKVGAKDEDTDGLINLARDINGVEVALFFKEIKNGMIKVGLRSKEYADVSKVAQVFGGGGHIRASGCTVLGDINTVKNSVLNEIAKII
jgi:phosphoesterase RecJ-like protein